MVTPKPVSVRVRSYQVGFGDCFLVTILYSRELPDKRAERHILIDFGAKALADGGPTLSQVAAKIAEHCDGRLDVVAVTHRHQDHVSGFGGKKAQDVLGSLEPRLIIRPWTDVPSAQRDGGAGLGADSLAFLNLLDTLADHNEKVQQEFALDGRVVARRAKALADLGVKNVQAIAMLESWVTPDRCRWVHAGDAVEIDDIVPGIRLDVLGPPTLEQVPAMKSYASSSAEYWLGMAQESRLDAELLAPREKDELVPAKETVAAPRGLGRASWLLDKLHDQGPSQVLDIVEGFDDVLNNTSLVLLLTVGKRTLLFGGDAQVENWSFALDRAYGDNGQQLDRPLRRRLANVDLYKVGHHGSRNATPRRLVELWRQDRRAASRLVSIVSTRKDTYGSTVEGKVPKKELLDALGELGPVHSTDGMPAKAWWFDVEAPAAGAAGFVHSVGPDQD